MLLLVVVVLDVILVTCLVRLHVNFGVFWRAERGNNSNLFVAAWLPGCQAGQHETAKQTNI